jgi:hypothetical protein
MQSSGDVWGRHRDDEGFLEVWGGRGLFGVWEEAAGGLPPVGGGEG